MKVIRKVVAGVVSALALTGTTLGGIALGRGMIPGEQGPQGEVGPQGNKGDTGAQGAKGDKGDTGATGKSAYEIAKAGGYTGTEAQWLASLKGETGSAGKSAYEIAKAGGYTGTEAQWLASLKGETGAAGKSAYDIAKAAGFTGTEAEWLEALVGEEGLSAYQIAKNNGFDGEIDAWLESLEGSDGASAYEIYKQFHTDYAGTEQDFANIFEDLVKQYENKGNITFKEWTDNVKNNPFTPHRNALNYADSIPFAPFDSQVAEIYSSYPFNSKYEIETIFELDDHIEGIVSIKGRTEAYVGSINGELAVDMTCSMVCTFENGSTYNMINDSITLMPCEGEFYLVYKCKCEDAEEYDLYAMKIKDANDYRECSCYLVHGLMMSVSSYQFSRAGGNVIDDEAVGIATPISDFFNMMTNSKCDYDEENDIYSLKSNSGTNAIEYEYKMTDMAGVKYISETKSSLDNYVYQTINSTGKINSTTKFTLQNEEGHVFPEHTVEEIESNYSCFPYAFGGIMYHSIGSVLNTMMVDTNIMVYGSLDTNNYYMYKELPRIVNCEIDVAKNTFTVGDKFSTQNINVYAFYSNGYYRWFSLSDSGEVFADCFADTYILHLNENGEFTTPGVYDIPVQFSLIGFGQDYVGYYRIYVNEAPTPVTKKAVSLSVSGIDYNYTVGEAYSEENVEVTVKYDDGSTRTALPCGPSDHNGYIINANSLPMESGKVTTPGLYPMSINCEGVDYYYQILVSAAPAAKKAVSLSVTGIDYNYTVGDTYSEENVEVTVHYDDGSTRTALPCGPSDHNGYIVNANSLPMESLKLTTAGLFPMEVNCEGVKFSYQVLVSPAPATKKAVSLSVTGIDYNYTVGDTYSEENVEVTVHYDDGSTRTALPCGPSDHNGYIINANSLPMESLELTTAGLYPMEITCEGVKFCYQVFVAEQAASSEPTLVGMKFIGQNVNFNVGSEFSVGDLVVTGIYSDGSEEEIKAFEDGKGGYKIDTSRLPISQEGKLDSVGIYYVEVSCDDTTYYYPIYVAVAGQPIKNLDSSGLIIDTSLLDLLS